MAIDIKTNWIVAEGKTTELEKQSDGTMKLTAEVDNIIEGVRGRMTGKVVTLLTTHDYLYAEIEGGNTVRIKNWAE